MSEYQYYEFRAIDRPLTHQEMAQLRTVSTRGKITPTSFKNEYHWGDFKGDIGKLIRGPFDVFVYTANWGSREFIIKIPARAIDLEKASLYCGGEAVGKMIKSGHLLIMFEAHDEDQEWRGWMEGDFWMSALIPIRQDLMAGDFRSLYLRWLYRRQQGKSKKPKEAPLVPSGMRRLTTPLVNLAGFLGLEMKGALKP